MYIILNLKVTLLNDPDFPGSIAAKNKINKRRGGGLAFAFSRKLRRKSKGFVNFDSTKFSFPSSKGLDVHVHTGE